MMRFLLILAALPLLANSQSLVIVGGNEDEDNSPIWEATINQAGGKGVAVIAVFTTATMDTTAGKYHVNQFLRFGALNATHFRVTEVNNAADDPFVADHVRRHTGVYFTGGDQLRITNSLRPNGRETLVMQAIKQVFNAGGVVAGSSAGAACLAGSLMITGGISYNALVYGAHPELTDDSYDLTYEPNGGLGLMSRYIVDTHFSERGREARLIRLLQDTRNVSALGSTRGFGLDEDMALVVTGFPNNPVGKVVGSAGGVFFADVSNLVSNPSTTTNFQQVTTTYLTLDDVIDMNTGVVTYAAWKTPLAGLEYHPNALPSTDILSSEDKGQWRDTALLLMNNRNDRIIDNYSYETDPQFKVTFNRQSAVAFGGFYPEEPSRYALSYRNLRVDILGL